MSWILIFNIISKTNAKKIKDDIKRIEEIIQKYPCKICIRHYRQYLDFNKLRYDKIQTKEELNQWFIDYKSTVRGADRAAPEGRRKGCCPKGNSRHRRRLRSPKLMYL